MIGKGTVEFQSHKINQANQGPEVETDIHRNKVAFAETGVWLIKNPVSRQLHEEIIKEVNQLPFIGSSQDVGANTQKKEGITECRQRARAADCSSYLPIHGYLSVNIQNRSRPNWSIWCPV